jgi:hypothetical protein
MRLLEEVKRPRQCFVQTSVTAASPSMLQYRHFTKLTSALANKKRKIARTPVNGNYNQDDV